MPEETGSDLYLTDISPDDKPWDVHRAVASKVESLYEQVDYNRYALRIRECSRWLGFALELQQDCSYKLKLHTCQFCRVRHCPVCQWRRSLMWRARFFQTLPKVIEAYPTARWLFLTLTVKNCPLEELRATLQSMSKAWERLSKLKQFPAIGWVRSVEVTRAENDFAHPHFHCLLMVPASYFSHGYIKQEEWTELWRRSLRADYTPIVNVKTVKDKRKRSPSPKEPERIAEVLDSSSVGQLPTGLVSGILETLKYSVKPADLVGSGADDEETFVRNAQWLAELTTQLHKTRAISVGGVLRQYISEEEPEDLIHAEDEEISLTDEDVQIWFGWREMVQRYLKQEKT